MILLCPSPKTILLTLLAALAFSPPHFAAKPAPPAVPPPVPTPTFLITGQTVISLPGYYKVMNDFAVAKGIPITIQADNVTVDLNRHTITGNPENAVIATADLVGLDNIRVTGGTLIGGHHGVQIMVPGENTRKSVQVDHLKIINSGSSMGIAISGNDNRLGAPGRVDAIITDNVIQNPAGSCFFGIMLAHSSASRVKNNWVSGCQRGLNLNSVENSVVEGNQFTENSYAGIAADNCRFNRIENNQLSSNGAYAITLTGSNNVIERNVFMNTQGTGLSIQPGPTFASIGNIHGGNLGNCANCYDITEGNLDAGGNLPAPVALPPITRPRKKRS